MNTSSFWSTTFPTLLALILNICVVIVRFLDPTGISDALAGLLITIISLIAGAFHVQIVTSQQTMIETLESPTIQYSNQNI